MGWLQLGWVASIVFILYYIQQIKMTLKGKGYEVGPFSGWISDIRKFKQMANSERDEKRRGEYIAILNGFYFAMLGFGALTIMVFSR